MHIPRHGHVLSAGWLIALLALFFSCAQPAHAQAKTCRSESDNCDVAEAQAACMSYPAGATNSSIVGGATRRQCPRYESSSLTGFFVLLYWGNNSSGNEVGAFSEGTFYWRNACASQSSYTGTGPWGSGGSARNGSLGCRKGCDGVWQANADSTMTWSPLGNICPEDEKKNCDSYGDGYYWNATLKVCEPPEGKCNDGKRPNSLGQCAPEPCPDGMAQQIDGTCKKKESECPAGNVRSPDGKCLPGEGQCASGEVRGADGTCKRDSDNDGEPDEPGEDEFFSGGEDCTTPPTCSGSTIMCGIARINWRIDCNTRKNRNIAGGSCAAMPICTGEKCDALEYSQLLMQWRTACALEKAAQAGQGGDGGVKDHLTAMKQAEVNALRAIGQDDGHAGVDPSKVFRDIAPEGQVKQNMFGGGASQCSYSFTIGGKIVGLPDQFWTVANLIRWLMIASAYVWVAIMLTR